MWSMWFFSAVFAGSESICTSKMFLFRFFLGACRCRKEAAPQDWIRELGKVLSTQFLELKCEVFDFPSPSPKTKDQVYHVFTVYVYQSHNRQRAAGPPRKDRGKPSKCKASASRMATCAADSPSRDAGSSQKKGLRLF